MSKLWQKGGLSFIKNNPQLIYGVVLLVLIPAVLIVNAILFINNAQKVLDFDLLRKANLAAELISPRISAGLADPASLQKTVEDIIKKNEDIFSLDVLKPEADGFKVVASLDPQVIGQTSKFFNNIQAWQSGEAIGYKTTSAALSTESRDLTQNKGAIFWALVKPVLNDQGEKVALVTLKVSSQVISEAASEFLYTRTLIILLVSVVIIVLLLWNNTKLFQYAVLFRKIKELDVMKDEFISMASHELRAPITGIRGYLQMTVDNSFGVLPKEAKEKLRLVLSESDRLRDLVEDLLEVSRIQQGRLKLDLKPLAVQPLVEGVVKPFELQAKQKNLQLIIDLRPDLPKILVDENRIKQILVNLVSNAIKYSLKGKVTISAELVKGKTEMVKIKVTDTGIGMSAKERERLFEKFYRIKNEKTTSVSGTGLGLWITKELVTLMKGEIYVDSMENVGTQMTVLLPAQKSKSNQ